MPRLVTSVERAAAALFELAEGELGTNELARRLRIDASTASRLLATLAASELVEQAPESGRYRLGAGVLRLGNSVLARLDLRGLARPQLVALASETGETVTLSAPGEHDAFTVDFVQSASSVQSVARIGRPSVGYATATGKVLLAFGDASLPDGPLERFTSRTVVDRDEVARELERVREQGWAEAAGEREPDLNAVAAPIFGGRGELAAILGVQGPAPRFDGEAMRSALAPLRERARAMSVALGWSG
jgi:DNA-binding IclR family transcriptional regulator